MIKLYIRLQRLMNVDQIRASEVTALMVPTSTSAYVLLVTAESTAK
jgi:hypothetical protein